MATMIPPEIPSTTPSGESILFYKLRDDPGTNGWFVLHSLDIRRHRTKAEGEIDMVILIPEQGILCLEVKGCEVSRHTVSGSIHTAHRLKAPSGRFLAACIHSVTIS